jgi:hypothetical protein
MRGQYAYLEQAIRQPAPAPPLRETSPRRAAVGAHPRLRPFKLREADASIDNEL